MNARMGECATRQTGQRVEAVLGFGLISPPSGKERHNVAQTYRPAPGKAAKTQTGEEEEGAPNKGLPSPQEDAVLGRTILWRWRGGEKTCAQNQACAKLAGTFARIFLLFFYFCCALFRHHERAPARAPGLGTTCCSSAAPSRSWIGPAGAEPGAGYKGRAVTADCCPKMRPMDSGEACAEDGPGDSPAITPASLPADSPAPEPSAERAPAAGQGEGPGSPSVSGPPAGACPASEAGSEAGAPRTSSFAPLHEDAQSVTSNSDAPRTGFKSQGSLAPRTTELGTRKAADIWKTPAAYSSQRPEVSRPEHSTFIREQEEGKPTWSGDPAAGETRAAQGRRGAVGSRRSGPSGTQSPSSTRPRVVSVCSARPVASFPPPPLLSVPDFRQWARSRGPRALPRPHCTPVAAPDLRTRVPTSRVYRSARRGAGAAGGRCPHALSLRWPAAPATTGRWVGRGGGFANLLAAGRVKVQLSPTPPTLGGGGGGPLRQTLPLLFPRTLLWVSGDLWIGSRSSGAPTPVPEKPLSLSSERATGAGLMTAPVFMTREAPRS